MCGVFGWIKFRKDFTDGERASALAALRSLSHRGPDAEGHVADARLFVGHRRLSIIDLSDAANQPFAESDSRALLSFNGEIYNFVELRSDLEARGARFRTHSDTEVLYWSLRQDGEAALERLDGMFAGAWHDRDAGEHLIFRDPMGQKPLYYHLYDDGLIYASELRALLTIDGFRWQIDRSTFRRYLANGYYAWNTTPIVGVRKLLPGSLVHIRGNNVEERVWWRSIPGEDVLDIGPEEAVTETLRLLGESCRMTLRSDVPVGVFLSGGIDSSLIYKLCAAAGSGTSAFTVTMSEPDYDEGAKAREVVAAVDAGRNGAHREFHFDPATLHHAMQDVFARIDEPHGDPGFINAYAISRAARSEISVAIAGDGADELYCGYLPFKAVAPGQAMQLVPSPVIKAMWLAARTLPDSDGYLGLQFKALSFLNGVGAPPLQRFNLWLSTLEQDELAVLTGVKRRSSERDFFDFPDCLNEALGSLSALDQMSYCYQKVFLPEFVCHHTDRAAMLNSLEVRAPFLSTALIRFANRLPASIRMRNGVLKWPLRAALKRLGFSDALSGQKKQGFTLPLARWQRRELSSNTRALRAIPEVAEGLLDLTVLDRILDDHLSGRRNLYRIVHCLEVFRAWRSHYPAPRISRD
jgi:asparagine synthase (glutamine-hydrolysing)